MVVLWRGVKLLYSGEGEACVVYRWRGRDNCEGIDRRIRWRECVCVNECGGSKD